MQLLGMLGPWQIIVFLFIIASLLLPILAIIDIVRNEFTGSNKLIWVLIVLILPIIGSILYFIIGTKQKIRKTN